MVARFGWRRGCALVLLGLAGAGSSPQPARAAGGDLGADPKGRCASLAQANAGAMRVDAATLQDATPLGVADRGPTPASRISPAKPPFCRVLGHIEPTDPNAPPIKFQLNLPVGWNGRSVQYGGGGFNGVLITGLGLPPAHPFDKPAPLAQGFATYGTDSGHETKLGEPPQAFALNAEAFENFAHRSYKKVRDAAVLLMERAYGRGPDRLYFMGSSEGGREGLAMAQRYPQDFDGVFSRVPVINWTGLQHAGTRAGLATMGEGWLGSPQVKRVADAVLASCDARDGVADGLVADPAGCKARFDVTALACAPGDAGDDGCLNAAQIKAVQALHAPYRFPFPLANGVAEYPGWGVSGEATPASGPTGGWSAWWLGSAPPALPPRPQNGIAWIYGAGGMQYVFARDPKLDVRAYRPEDHAERVREVSSLMDATDPDLGAFKARGGKLIVLENMADYAQSPYAGIDYVQSVRKRMGRRRRPSSSGSTRRPASTMWARARRARSTCWPRLWAGWRRGARPATSKWSSSAWSRPLRSCAPCRCANGRLGRITRAATRTPRRASLARLSWFRTGLFRRRLDSAPIVRRRSPVRRARTRRGRWSRRSRPGFRPVRGPAR